jgi:hypothetical protein
MAMVIDYKHALSTDEARERVKALGEYLTNKHGLGVSWNADGTAKINGKVTLVTIEATLSFKDGVVHLEGKDPGFLLRGQATKYMNEKLGLYLDPKTPLDKLPRR